MWRGEFTMSSPKVVVIGATGAHGREIIKGLLESPTKFDINTISRKASVDKPQNAALREKGVKVFGVDMLGPREELVNVLRGADAVVAPIDFDNFEEQKALVDACKEAGVKRLTPSNFAPVMPAYNVMGMRETKEATINYIKEQRVPYTIIDVAWWYQNLPFKIPSGRTDYMSEILNDDARIIGTGDVPIAFSNLRSIGTHVARILADPRTINKYVHIWDEVLTMHQVVETLEEVSGEKVERVYNTQKDMEETMAKCKAKLAADPKDQDAGMELTVTQYFYSMGVRGDSTPEVADYLGYLDSRRLYPDIKASTLREYYKTVLEGKEANPYASS
ncbi:hypothetical protein PoMZ_02618 [Pyricularia oryzae]|uniref:NmrA-like domain-containing protein n=1 Tax=Pyricularia oryzae TaxID=318829 RepID=A0A4P7N5R1_PYROR|nr:hypothetical protein PoMZ_02618 [Pyricularia oryzae]